MDTHGSTDQTVEMETPRRPILARREVLRRVGIGAGMLALGGVAPAAPVLARGGAFAVVKSRPKVVLGSVGGITCFAPLYTAYHKGFFAAEGLDVELYAESATFDAMRALSSGTLSGEQDPAFAVFPAIEQGADIRLVGGLHGGCLRLLIGKHSGIRKAADFKGKAIGAPGPDVMLFFKLRDVARMSSSIRVADGMNRKPCRIFSTVGWGSGMYLPRVSMMETSWMCRPA